ncbi:SMC-Scp complex subunit ScpB [uncultured Ruminococcus sp.]|uniref:SMC-Scp complex subunit ScpB n=1 Tax=uncultured Ruminococcus sp. TaxID=165186 RepID=UPI0025E34C36|nr:SMC-Scp complex subunit ScpB [uncultured Ruminococcus sp.]
MEERTKPELYHMVEAVLFASGEPISVTRLAGACEAGEDAVLTALRRLAAEYAEQKSAVSVVQLGDSWQMCTRPEFAPAIQRAIETKKNAPLSPAAMEVLTIVAYNQPVSKSFVEHVRGVDSGSVVNTLVEKELLTEAGRLDVPGKPIAYATTPHFLRCFGLRTLDDLPPLPMLTESMQDKSETDAEESETIQET